MTSDVQVEIVDTMPQRWLLGVGAVVSIAVLLLTWLFMQAAAVDPQAHIDYTQTLRSLREADAVIDGELLASRLELSRNYDALAGYVGRVIEAGDRAVTPPAFLAADARRRSVEKAEALRHTLGQKAQLIEAFKRRNAILRNSLAYFPIAAEGVLAHDLPEALRKAVERYTRLLLAYARTPDADRFRELEGLRTRLEPAAETSGMDNLVLHGDIIGRYVGEVDALTQEILSLPTARQYEALIAQYTLGHENAQKRAAQFRVPLYLLALALMSYLAVTFVRLDRARRLLAAAHRELSARYEAQQRAEAQLILHATAFHNAHEGITLTDADGNIIDVNPAFSRITGYERAEAIGRNPRILKSGRQEPEFYDAMWKSLRESGSWRGEIWDRTRFGEVYPELLSIAAVHDADGKVTNYVAVFSDISRIKEQERQLKQMAYYDALTDLPNRALLADRIAQAVAQTRRDGALMAVCYLDLDGFKPINDTFGHKAGDRLLIEMGRRLKDGMRGGDTVARLGGDEFVLLLLGMTTIEECKLAARRLLNTVAQPIAVAADVVTLSASIGVTIYPHDDGDPDTLLRHADQAMYLAKQAGKDCYHLFDPDEDRQARRQRDRLSRLNRALEAKELVLYYQPKVDMRDGTVTGMEALLRWQHPERGLIPPLDFLPLAEEHDLIVEIGDWVIDTALGQLSRWNDEGLDLSVSVNVAGRQLQNPAFVEKLKQALGRYPTVASRQLELEILETAALEDMALVSRIIDECGELGINFSLDDFGTGYSSLTYLKRLPATTLKIDKSFIRDMLNDPENLAIVQGILGLATAFQRRAIAEGVESIEHGRMLMQLGCDYAQGNGVARPMAADKVAAWVRGWQPDSEWEALKTLHWDETDYPLIVAEVEHRRWISQLVRAVNEGKPIPHKLIDDHHRCRFGRWYEGRGRALYKEVPGFDRVDEPHRRAHQIAGRMDQLGRNGAGADAKQLIPELLVQRDEVLAALKALELNLAQRYKRRDEPASVEGA